jgi:hypothetical protein
MTEFVGHAASMLCFAGGLVAWYMDQYTLACNLLAASYVLTTYASTLTIRDLLNLLNRAVNVAKEQHEKLSRR